MNKKSHLWVVFAAVCCELGARPLTFAATTTVADKTGPTVSLRAPLANAVVSGIFSIEATAQDTSGIQSVSFKIDGKRIGNLELKAPYKISVDSKTLQNGPHNLTAYATDSKNNIGTSKAVIFKSSNSVAQTDTQKPAVSIVLPTNGQVLSGTIRLLANANDNVGIASVKLQLDGQPVGTLQHQLPYDAFLDSTKIANGTHYVDAVAVDAAGNTQTSSRVTIKIANVVSSPSPQPVPTPTPDPTPTPVTLPPVTPSDASGFDDPSCNGLSLVALPRDSQGWTILPDALSIGGREIYVTSSGAGPYDPAHNIYTVRTAAEGFALLRKGYPDSLLFNRGETFTFDKLPASVLTGASWDRPMVIGAYGSGARPVMRAANAAVLGAWNTDVSNLVIMSLDFQAVREGQAGLKFQKDGKQVSQISHNILIEDVRVQGFVNAVVVEASVGMRWENFILRRSQILDSHGDSHSQGIYTSFAQGLTIEENVFDHNGYVSRTSSGADAPSIFAHNMYLQAESGCLRVRGNISAQAASHGLQARAGGIVENNFFARDALGMSWGLVNGGTVLAKGIRMGVQGRIVGNVVWESVDINSTTPRDGGLYVGNAKKLLIENNLMAYHVLGANRGSGLSLNPYMGIGLHNMTIRNNVMTHLQKALEVSGQAFGPVSVKDDGSVVNAAGTTLISATASGLALNQHQDIADAGNGFENNVVQDISGQAVSTSGFQNWTGDFGFRSNIWNCSHPTSCTVYGALTTWVAQTREVNPILQPKTFSDGGRNLSSYLASFDATAAGLDSDGAFNRFIGQARQMDKSNWDSHFTANAVTAYLRQGFDIEPDSSQKQ